MTDYLTTEHEQTGHPIHTLKLENQVLQSLLNDEIDGLLDQIARKRWSYKNRLIAALKDLKQIEAHYQRKEILLFNYLEKYGIVEPPQVMWIVDDEIRKRIERIIKYAQNEIIDFLTLFEKWSQLKEEIEEMIFKEEEIIFPVALELLRLKDWEQMAADSFAIGFSYIPEPSPWQASQESLLKEKENDEARQLAIEKAKEKNEEIVQDLVQEMPMEEKNYQWEEASQKEEMVFPTGTLNFDQILGISKALPVDFTFFDIENRVRFYSEGQAPIFPRTKSTIGREAMTVYPSNNMRIVDSLLNDFKSGKKEQAEYWMEMGDRKIQIRYFPVKDQQGQYLGCLEVAQEVVQIEQAITEENFFESYVKEEENES